MRVLLALLTVLACAAAAAVLDSSRNDTLTEFKQYVAHHKKHYNDQEFIHRHAIFIKRKAEIAAHNLRHKAGKVGWKAAMTRWSDMTVEEFRKAQGYIQMNGSHGAIPASSIFTKSKRLDSIDYRQRGVMTGVKDQGQCGTCWAFATTGAVEACIAINTARGPPSLSEQQLQDCMFSKKCDGGGGGADAIDWVVNNGINLEQVYPYTRSDGQCHRNGLTFRATSRVHGNTEDQLYDMLRNGPVLIGLNADPLMTYGGGVITDAGLSRGRNHAVVVVGVQDNCVNGQACWIIRNSWGGGWGEGGHFRVLKGQSVIGLGDDSDMPIKCSGAEGGMFGDFALSRDMWGSDLDGMPVKAQDAQDCQNQCYSYRNNECGSFTFDACGSDCWLKRGTPTSGFGTCRISGSIQSVRKQQGQWGVMDGLDRQGGDLGGMPVRANDAQDCQNQCRNRGDCAAFSFNTCGGNECWLKSSFGGGSPNNCRLSGSVSH